jgi:hypothetical protein
LDVFGKRRKRNVQAARALAGLYGRGNPQHPQTFSGNPMGERAKEKRRRRTGAETNDHSIFNQLRRSLAGELLESIRSFSFTPIHSAPIISAHATACQSPVPRRMVT